MKILKYAIELNKIKLTMENKKDYINNIEYRWEDTLCEYEETLVLICTEVDTGNRTELKINAEERSDRTTKEALKKIDEMIRERAKNDIFKKCMCSINKGYDTSNDRVIDSYGINYSPASFFDYIRVDGECLKCESCPHKIECVKQKEKNKISYENRNEDLKKSIFEILYNPYSFDTLKARILLLSTNKFRFIDNNLENLKFESSKKEEKMKLKISFDFKIEHIKLQEILEIKTKFTYLEICELTTRPNKEKINTLKNGVEIKYYIKKMK